jgi:hypothetical protein
VWENARKIFFNLHFCLIYLNYCLLSTGYCFSYFYYNCFFDDFARFLAKWLISPRLTFFKKRQQQK